MASFLPGNLEKLWTRTKIYQKNNNRIPVQAKPILEAFLLKNRGLAFTRKSGHSPNLGKDSMWRSSLNFGVHNFEMLE
ncbi:hypothetical protein AM1_3920 [Acaryochloris marina MBIC11017]|uniref:Uncharacterized protein n=1 Tax=Acaryochloris marina (strain MBIC 11017) TaxID=329726 RepID=B0C885_ACAM1|nr:hypothetical protein AM1_3920 [Acaryochloris marina MBIC11017]